MKNDSVEYSISKRQNEVLADEFTGIRTFQGFEKELLEKIENMSKEEIDSILTGKESLYIESAGAGSYYKVFESLGFTKILNFEVSSSAGNWIFIGKHKDPNIGWRICYQENMYPEYGFEYGCSDYGSSDPDGFLDLVAMNSDFVTDENRKTLLEYMNK